jgi:pyrroline-5-carboxylate reductase
MRTPEKNNVDFSNQLAILGGGNIGTSIAKGLVGASRYSPEQIIITRRRVHLLNALAQERFIVQSDNRDAVRRAKIVIIAVHPQQVVDLLHEIRADLVPDKHVVISIVSGVSINEIVKHIGKDVCVVRAMPNLAIQIQESMTCLAANQATKEALDLAKSLFDSVGKTVVIDEELMIAATALCACGIAFFLRSIRAASQGGIEIGFHSDEALVMAAQTAKGAASLLLSSKSHPEGEIDKVTTPQGCTIAGLNEMEHRGFSSAMIMGIITSGEKAARLFENNSK